MTAPYDVTAVGHAIVDVLAPADDAFLTAQNLAKGAMTLIDQDRALSLYGVMAQAELASGGSAGNTIAGAASLGGKCGYIGKVADDELGKVFRHDMKAQGVQFDTSVLTDGSATGRCLINITPDAQRTMATFLGAAAKVGPADVDAALIQASNIVYLEGYLFDTPSGREAFVKASELARAAGRKTAITMSDRFVVDRWRADLLPFIDQHIDIVFANEDELLAMYETEDFFAAQSALRAKVDLAFVTRSDQGSVILTKDDTVLVPVFDVDTLVDTTGAGDQYAAGAMFGLSRGLDLYTCGRLGAMAAAEVISHYGPRPLVSLKDMAGKFGLI
ncbi:adenosine kinase [Asticcacaulis machinosus]|uniref:Adenosine kinase n=1 Tax=Asticcacaulis machinosus TaxID=2984211 RepID=A0ABT5HIQ6_9CAUL|nr:adenosine kinase [Asticcacaulis machinosus]MDC7676126.1 adenosine kinase [Asticcacaulis machinosus]